MAFDPVAMENTRSVLPVIEYTESPREALVGADACVLVTEWGEFVHLDWAAARDLMRRPLVIDGRNALDGEALVALGFTYEGMGMPAVAEVDLLAVMLIS